MFEALKTALDHAEQWARRALKTDAIAPVVAQYEAALNDEVDAVYNGDETQSEFEDHINALLAAFALAIYLAATGKTEDELTDDELGEIAAWIDDQAQYIGGLAEAVAAAGAASAEEIAALQAGIVTRIGYWVSALSVFGAVSAGNTAAGGQRLGKWRLGGTVEHCATCSMLANDEAHPVSWFLDNGYLPREPDSPTLECHGWRCDCGVFDVITGEQLL